MGGGLLQLVAYGAQDVYLTGNPQITFFKVVYRRHTNFAIEAIEQTPTGSPNLGSRISVQVTRNGDLIHRVYFHGMLKNNNADSSTAIALVPNVGQKLLKTIELEIGGQRIDKHFSEWLYVWNELTMPPGKKEGYYNMIGGEKLNRCTKLSGGSSYELYVPLEFWFCRNVGLALPLIALQYHEVKINIEFENADKLVDVNEENFTYQEDVNDGSAIANDSLGGSVTDLKLNEPKLWVDYIFLDTDERRRFAQLSHEYLIEQVQFTGTDEIISSTDENNMKSVRMSFNHPCKELIWFVRASNPEGKAVWWNNFSDISGTSVNSYPENKNPIMRAKIMLNGNERFAERPGTYFSLVQPYQHHENTPDMFHPGINVYSFALKPEEHQPSGTLNMSRIDTAVLSLSSSVAGTLFVVAVNYNVLRILSGMGGLAYSN